MLEKVAGMPAAALDAAFRADLAQKLARYATQYLPTESLRSQSLRGTRARAPPRRRTPA